MRFSALMAALALAAAVPAAPINDTSATAAQPMPILEIPEFEEPALPRQKHRLVREYNINGTQLRFSVPSHCRRMLYNQASCGLGKYYVEKVKPKRSLVSLPAHIFDHWGRGPNNLLCAKTAYVTFGGFTKKAVVAGRNTNEHHSIEMCADLWESWRDVSNKTGVVKGFRWFVNVNLKENKDGDQSGKDPYPPPLGVLKSLIRRAYAMRRWGMVDG